MISSTSYIVPVVLYNAKKVSSSNIQKHQKNNTKRTPKPKTPKEKWKLKIYTYFIFELKNPRTLILRRWLVP